MPPGMMDLIEKKDLAGIRAALSADPSLANKGIPFDDKNPTLCHPLHRICDRVFEGRYSDEDGVEIARVFLEFGADVNGFEFELRKDTPLIAAASLHADRVGLLYLEHGADVRHQGCHGGTALHWAAWTGRDTLVRSLIDAGSDIHLKDLDFDSTPLFWAIHGYVHGGDENRHQQLACARMLIAAGADIGTPNAEGATIRDLLGENSAEWKILFQPD